MVKRRLRSLILEKKKMLLFLQEYLKFKNVLVQKHAMKTQLILV